MIRHSLSVAAAGLLLSAPLTAFAQAPMEQPVQVIRAAYPDVEQAPDEALMVPAYGEDEQAYAGPMEPQAYPLQQSTTLVPVPSRAVWIPGHYNWDPARQNYVWREGEYSQPPHDGAQWVSGHWVQTPNSWLWVDGHWS